MLISTTDISPLHSLLPGVWSCDEDGFGDATGEPGDKLGGTNMFPSPYSVWPKNILQFAEYAGSNIMNPRVTLNTSVWIFSPSTPILTRDTVTRNPSCPLLHHDISLSGLQSHPLPSIVTCDICSNARTCSSEYSNWHQDLERPNDGKQHLAFRVRFTRCLLTADCEIVPDQNFTDHLSFSTIITSPSPLTSNVQ